MKNMLSFLGAALLAVTASAQTGTDQPMSKSDQLNYFVFGSAAVLFVVFAIRSFYVASVSLRENGGEMKFQFPMLRSMAKNTKTVGTVIIIMIICAVVWLLSVQQ